MRFIPAVSAVQFRSPLPKLNTYRKLKSWPHGQAVKTSPFHGGISGSNPDGVTTWAHSSAGRAPALQAGGHRFKPCCAHHVILICKIKYCGLVVQLVRMLACHARGRGFESLPGRHKFCLDIYINK